MYLLRWMAYNQKELKEMILSKSAISNFLNKKTDDFYWIKNCSSKDIYDAIKEKDPTWVFKKECPEPFVRQLVCFYIGICFNNFLFFLDMGAGKTRIILDLIAYRIKHGHIKRALVVVPGEPNIDGWEDETEQYSNLKFVGIVGDKNSRINLTNVECDVACISYSGLVSVMTTSCKGKRKIDKKLANDFCSKYDFIGFDEIHLCKNKSNLRYKLCNLLAKHSKFRYAATGTPFGRSLEDLWSQFYLIDRGDTLGNTLGVYREAYFEKVKNRFVKNYDVYDYKIKPESKALIHKRIKHRSIRYEESEFSDLPEKVYNIVKFKPNSSIRKYYKEQIESLIKSENSESKELSFHKLRQIASGYIKVNDDDGDFYVDFDENPKLEFLDTFLKSTNDKVVIFYQYVNSAKLIENTLSKLNIKFSKIGSGGDKSNTALSKFKNKNCRVLLINVLSSGTTGLNLQHYTNKVIYFESPVSPIIRAQSEKRIHRSGQKEKKTFYYDLVIKNSVEEKILFFLKEGKDLLNEVLNGNLNNLNGDI